MEEQDKNSQTPKSTYINKAFWIGIQTIFIFALPAALGALVGVKLDEAYGTERKITILILIGTFIFSWILVIIKYRQFIRTLKRKL